MGDTLTSNEDLATEIEVLKNSNKQIIMILEDKLSRMEDKINKLITKQNKKLSIIAEFNGRTYDLSKEKDITHAILDLMDTGEKDENNKTKLSVIKDLLVAMGADVYKVKETIDKLEMDSSFYFSARRNEYDSDVQTVRSRTGETTLQRILPNASQKKKIELIKNLVNTLNKVGRNCVLLDDVLSNCPNYGLGRSDAIELIERLRDNGQLIWNGKHDYSEVVTIGVIE